MSVGTAVEVWCVVCRNGVRNMISNGLSKIQSYLFSVELHTETKPNHKISRKPLTCVKMAQDTKERLLKVVSKKSHWDSKLFSRTNFPSLSLIIREHALVAKESKLAGRGMAATVEALGCPALSPSAVDKGKRALNSGWSLHCGIDSVSCLPPDISLCPDSLLQHLAVPGDSDPAWAAPWPAHPPATRNVGSVQNTVQSSANSLWLGMPEPTEQRCWGTA